MASGFFLDSFSFLVQLLFTLLSRAEKMSLGSRPSHVLDSQHRQNHALSLSPSCTFGATIFPLDPKFHLSSRYSIARCSQQINKATRLVRHSLNGCSARHQDRYERLAPTSNKESCSRIRKDSDRRDRQAPSFYQTITFSSPHRNILFVRRYKELEICCSKEGNSMNGRDWPCRLATLACD